MEFTAAMCRNASLKAGGQFAVFTLAGEVSAARPGREDACLPFYQQAVASGRTAARLGTMQSGEAITGSGVLGEYEGSLVFVVQDAARLPHDPVRLDIDDRGGARLLLARQRVRVRGMLIAPPETSKLQNGTPVTNVRVGLSPVRAAQADAPDTTLVPLELAAYGDAALLLADQEKGAYLTAWGLLQTRQGERRRFVRLEVQDLEILHETRALI